MRSKLHSGLEELKQRLLAMGGLAEQAVQRAIEAYRGLDVSLCDTVLRGEAAINRTQRDIDELALDLLAMQQPMATDLRFILAAIKINADLERVGDQAVNIAERVKDLCQAQPQALSIQRAERALAPLPVDVPHVASLAVGMIRQSLDAFIDGDATLAQQVLQRDDAVDQIHDEAFVNLLKVMAERPDLTRQALDSLLIVRNLERVADHATNIAEDVIFWVEGADVRHRFGQR